MIKNIKNKINRLKIKYEVDIAKGMIAEIMKEVDWNEDRLTIENQYKLRQLATAVKQYEEMYNLK